MFSDPSPESVAEQVFAWLTGPDTVRQPDPVLRELRRLVDGEALLPTEAKAIWCYSAAAASVTTSLATRVGPLADALCLEPAFCVAAQARLTPLAGGSGAPNATELLAAPPTCLQAEIESLLVDAERGRWQDGPQPLRGLDPKLVQHPGDRVLLQQVGRLPGIDSLVATVIDFRVRWVEMMRLGGTVLVTPESMPSVWSSYAAAGKALGLDTLPALYVGHGEINAYCIGADKPFLFVSSTLLDMLNEVESRYILGHELGHYVCGHAKYHTLAEYVAETSAGLLSQVTLGMSEVVANTTLRPLLNLWSRKSEFSADRAGLLACQSLDGALRALIKISGFPRRRMHEIDVRSVVEQAAQYERALAASGLDRLRSLGQHLSLTHPLPIYRALELLRWYQDGYYHDILDADEGRRARMASLVDSDAQAYELVCDAVRVLADWAAQRYGLAHRVAARGIRSLTYDHTVPAGSPLSDILEIQLSLAVDLANEKATATVAVVVAKGANQVDVHRLAVPMVTQWADLPAELRRDIITHQSADRVLYSRLKRA